MALKMSTKSKEPTVEGFEDIEECLDGVDLEELIEEEEEPIMNNKVEKARQVLTDVIFGDPCTGGDDADVNDDFDDFLDVTMDDTEELEDACDCEESNVYVNNPERVSSVYSAIEDKVNGITELMDDMVSVEKGTGIYVSEEMANRLCNHLEDALKVLRCQLVGSVSKEFRW